VFEQALSKNTRTILAILKDIKIIQKAYMAGGSALALHLCHRLSYDLDFFTQEEFNEQELLMEIEKKINFHLIKVERRTILIEFKDVRFSIFYYSYPVLCPFKKFGDINIADIPDIAAMKIAAISSRGTRRDFIDMYFICQEVITLEEAIRFYDKKYKNLADAKTHILKSLVYFKDAELDEMPRMLKKISWKKIKAYFETEVKKIFKKI